MDLSHGAHTSRIGKSFCAKRLSHSLLSGTIRTLFFLFFYSSFIRDSVYLFQCCTPDRIESTSPRCQMNATDDDRPPFIVYNDIITTNGGLCALPSRRRCSRRTICFSLVLLPNEKLSAVSAKSRPRMRTQTMHDNRRRRANNSAAHFSIQNARIPFPTNKWIFFLSFQRWTEERERECST